MRARATELALFAVPNSNAGTGVLGVFCFHLTP